MSKKEFNEKRLVSLFLRIGLATVFIYAGVAALINPTAWVGFIPEWIFNIISENIFLPMHASLDIIIGIWLITGKKAFYSSLVAGLTLLSIIIFNIGAMDIIFRDIAILLSTVALMILHFKEIK